MNLDKINNHLFELYASKLGNLKQMYAELSKLGIEDFANPLLLKCHEGYVNAKNKIIFIGQETNSWYSEDANRVLSTEDIKQLQKAYLDFMLPQSYSSPFWNFIYDVSSQLSPGSVSYMWSNIWKIGKDSGAGKADSRLNELETTYFNIGMAELEILKPDIVVFLSGPNYDQDIRFHFGNFKILKSFDKCFDQLGIEGLNCNAYRLYHPNYHNYLGTEKKQEYKDLLIKLLK